MVLHGMSDNIGHLDKTTVILLFQRVHDAALDWLEAIFNGWNGAVADCVRGELQEVIVDKRMQWTASAVSELIFSL